MNVEAMVKKHQDSVLKTPTLLMMKADKHTVDVFIDHDYLNWSRYGYHKDRWHYQKGTRLSVVQLKEMVNGLSKEN